MPNKNDGKTRNMPKFVNCALVKEGPPSIRVNSSPPMIAIISAAKIPTPKRLLKTSNNGKQRYIRNKALSDQLT
ncbi:hypothetical protein GCM10008943_33530 [Paenochrobactrum glaciei]|uniref:Uncharacterized protein n=1 Tax=Paenochrobactrum glaciei TaxID=486407 RepID=A0ABN1GPN5_9HYPH